MSALPGRKSARAWSALLSALSALAASQASPALAQETTGTESSPVTASERRAAEAFQAYTRKEYAAAVALYLEAYDAAPSGSILYNIARIYDMKLADRPLAIVYYRRYISDPGAYTERIEVANQRLVELRRAEISASKSTEPAPSPRPSDAAATERASAPQPSRDPAQEPRGGWSTLRWSGAAVGAVGLVGVGIGAGFGLSAMSKASTANESCAGNACTSQQGVEAARAANTSATISNIGFGAGGALLLTGAALFLWGGERTPERLPRAEIQWETQATSSGVSLRLSRTW